MKSPTLHIASTDTLDNISGGRVSALLYLWLPYSLSIVRFRAAIKEPEELAYLFATIAIGLGLGANQAAATVAAVSRPTARSSGRSRTISTIS